MGWTVFVDAQACYVEGIMEVRLQREFIRKLSEVGSLCALACYSAQGKKKQRSDKDWDGTKQCVTGSTPPKANS